MAVGIDVVGGLRHVDVVVGMDERVFAPLPAQELDARFAITSLTFMWNEVPAPAWIGVDHKLVVVLSGQDLVGGAHDGGRLLGIERTQLGIGARRGELDLGDRADDLHGKTLPADRKVGDRARRLDSVVGVGGDFQGAQRVALDPRSLGRGGGPALAGAFARASRALDMGRLRGYGTAGIDSIEPGWTTGRSQIWEKASASRR